MIQALMPAETAQLDKERIAEIVTRLGPLGADEVISRNLEELAVLLAIVHKCVARANFDAIRDAATKITRLAAQIGMPTLSLAAFNVADVAGSVCGVALAATTDRLDRVGGASLTQVWELQDLSM